MSTEIFANYSIDLLDSKNPYYELKIQNYKTCIQSYKNGESHLRHYPLRATIQTNETCNLKCIMCQIHGQEVKRKLLSLSFKNLQKVVQELFPYLIEVHPTNIGEPLVYKYFDYFCKQIANYGVLLDLTTNGMLLNDLVILKISPILKDIKISFDGFKEETFQKIRKKSNYGKVKSNLFKLLKYKKENGHQFTVTLQMTINKLNYKELLEIIDFAHEIGVNRVKAYHVFSYFKEVDELSLLQHEVEFEEIRIQAINKAKKYNLRLEISEPQQHELNETNLIQVKCPLLWTECWIDCDTNIYPCHSHFPLKFGVLIEDFKKVWNSKNYSILRDAQVLGFPSLICKNCGVNYFKKEENQKVTYDIQNFFSKTLKQNLKDESIKWSNRSKQFFLNRQ